MSAQPYNPMDLEPRDMGKVVQREMNKRFNDEELTRDQALSLLGDFRKTILVEDFLFEQHPVKGTSRRPYYRYPKETAKWITFAYLLRRNHNPPKKEIRSVFVKALSQAPDTHTADDVLDDLVKKYNAINKNVSVDFFKDWAAQV